MEKMGYGGKLCHRSKHEDARFMGALGSRESRGLGSCKWSTYALSRGIGFLAIGVPTNSVDHGDLSRLFRCLILVICLGDLG
jgi:hypothetical protein